ncbi:hypothetical protein WMY93_006594 [Mugilogobius chulae]|uniref:Phosphoglycerate mutase n=1 Tax=Mugilogobius chulae TaxID=88201 RepID=A0AAW0PUG8_9GOBI
MYPFSLPSTLSLSRTQSCSVIGWIAGNRGRRDRAKLSNGHYHQSFRKFSAEGIERMAAYKLVLIRHGESCWNQENRFCGWFDADLSETGEQEARRGGQALRDQLPACESLKDTIARALPFWNDEIVPQIKEGKRVLIAAHGNSLRGIVKHLEGMSEEAIMELNLPTGIPIVYELDKNLKP